MHDYKQKVKYLIEEGIIVDPRNLNVLQISGDALSNSVNRYPLVEGVPVLLYDEKKVNEWITDSSSQKLSLNLSTIGKVSAFQKFSNFLQKDLRTRSSELAWENIRKHCEGKVCLSIGGGPRRCDDNFLNINLSIFENIDIVADCHYLPFKDNSVDCIFIEAVLEHLYDLQKCLKEIHRVLKPGGIVYSNTPFMQAYHGYPNHYQNLTISGHKAVFEINHFKVTEFGTSVKPTYAMIMLNTIFLKTYIPFIGRFLGIIFQFFGLLIFKYFDLFLEDKPSNHILASTTYVVAEKL